MSFWDNVKKFTQPYADDDYDDYGDYDYDYDDQDDYSDMDIDEEFGVSGPEIVAIAIFVIVFIIIFVLVMAIAIVLDASVINPLESGIRRFGLANLNAKAEVKEIGFGYDHNYKNGVKTMFFRDLYTFLWSLLFIIPGIVKSYEYQMIPYLLADNPQMTKEQAFEESKRMMQGQKWKAFVLDLSFIGWNILSALTLGILGIFYVQPYMDATHAALYEALRYGMPYNNAQYGFYNGMPQQQAPNGFTNNVPNSIVEENPNNQYQ